MIKKLLEKLFEKIKDEKDIDSKTKNGISIYFVEKILEERFKKPNFIGAKTVKGYFDKYVEKKENRSGEPNSELKDIISKYLGYVDFLDFENKNKSNTSSLIKIIKSSIIKKSGINNNSPTKWLIPTIIMATIISGTYFTEVFKSEDCIIWKTDHYQKIDCENEFSIPMLKDLNIKNFRKVKVEEIKVFFSNGNPLIWYGRSTNGKLEYFNSRGVHPITGIELKPITQYIINKYVEKAKN